MLTPRPYISFSQMTLFERSPEEWVNYYLYDQKQRVSRNMAYGSLMAEGLELGTATGDPLLDLMMARLPKFELMDKPFEAFLDNSTKGKNGKYEVITVLIKPDTTKADLSAFKEYKTSVRKWTQKMADDSASQGQICFYSTGMWLLKKKIPQDIELVNVQVDYLEDGRLAPTGELWRFPVQTTLSDVIKMTNRIRIAWQGIKDLCEKELL